jgi:hypothetical protein
VPYAAWWVAYRPAGLERRALDVAPGFAADSAAGALGALAGLAGAGVPEGADALRWGRPLAVVAVITLLWLLGRYRRVPPRTLALLTILVAFWILTGLRRAMLEHPDAARYLYVGALFILLLVAELARGVSLPRRWMPLLVAAVAVAVLSNAGTIRDAGRFLRLSAEAARADLGALELARDSVKPGYRAGSFPGTPFVSVHAGPYFAAADDMGSPAYSPAELATAPESARLTADTELIRIHDVGLQAGHTDEPSGPPPSVASVVRGEASEQGSCVAFRPAPVLAAETAAAFEIKLPATGVVVTTGRSAATVDVRRFAAGFSSVKRDTLTPVSSATLRIDPDSAPQPWHARVTAQGRVSVCGLR